MEQEIEVTDALALMAKAGVVETDADTGTRRLSRFGCKVFEHLIQTDQRFEAEKLMKHLKIDWVS